MSGEDPSSGSGFSPFCTQAMREPFEKTTSYLFCESSRLNRETFLPSNRANCACFGFFPRGPAHYFFRRSSSFLFIRQVGLTFPVVNAFPRSLRSIKKRLRDRVHSRECRIERAHLRLQLSNGSFLRFPTFSFLQARSYRTFIQPVWTGRCIFCSVLEEASSRRFSSLGPLTWKSIFLSARQDRFSSPERPFLREAPFLKLTVPFFSRRARRDYF